MRDLDINEIYDIRGLSDEQYMELWSYINNSKETVAVSIFLSFKEAKYLIFNSNIWGYGDIYGVFKTTHARTLFEPSYEDKLKQALSDIEKLKEQVKGLLSGQQPLKTIDKDSIPHGWIIVDKGGCSIENAVDAIVYYSGSYKSYGFNHAGEWTEIYNTENHYFKKDYKQLATPQEVETALIAEAKRRGFVEGFKVKCLVTGKEYYWTTYGSFKYNHCNNLFAYGACIFKNGKWAEPVKDVIRVGDVVKAWSKDENIFVVGVLRKIDNDNPEVYNNYMIGNFYYGNAKKITKQEAIDLLFPKE